MRSDGPVGDGSTFVTVYRGMVKDITLVEFDRPERLVVVGTNDKMDIDTSYAFTAQGAGTRVVVTTEVRPKGLISFLAPLLRLFVRRELAAKYTTVKQAYGAPTRPVLGEPGQAASTRSSSHTRRVAGQRRLCPMLRAIRSRATATVTAPPAWGLLEWPVRCGDGVAARDVNRW